MAPAQPEKPQHVEPSNPGCAVRQHRRADRQGNADPVPFFHAGQTESQLRARLARELRIPSASTFKTLADAERFVAQALRANKSAIEAWAKSAPVNAPPKAFNFQAASVVGEGVVRATGQLQQMTRMVVVLRRVQQQNRVYFILTAYPKP